VTARLRPKPDEAGERGGELADESARAGVHVLMEWSDVVKEWSDVVKEWSDVMNE
jgi:hypothetical protein